MKKIVGIFNREFTPVAFLNIENGRILKDFLDEKYKDSIEKALGEILAKDEGRLFLRREAFNDEKNEIISGLVPVTMDNPDYIYPLSEGLQTDDLLTAVVFEDAREPMIMLGKSKFTHEEKAKIWPEIINISEEDLGKLNKFRKDILPLTEELTQIEKEWEDFVVSKKQELS